MEILRGKLAQMQLEQHAESIDKLRAGESASWGQQIRNYVLQPYKLVKDTRTGYEETDPDAVLDGELDGFINNYLENNNIRYSQSLKLPRINSYGNPNRISSNNNKAFQLLYVDKTNEIILIDLYHLLIPAADHEHNETIKNPKLHYEVVKNNRFDISNVFE